METKKEEVKMYNETIKDYVGAYYKLLDSFHFRHECNLSFVEVRALLTGFKYEKYKIEEKSIKRYGAANE